MSAVANSPWFPLAAPRRLQRLRSDAALAERFAGGDEAAFAVLYERHRASVLAVCIGVLGSRHDAEDAAQEAFASLAVALRGTPPRELSPWLARVARNAAIDLARRRRAGSTSAAELDDRPAAPVSGAAAELETVIAGLRELPESQRTALLMRELAGHSYAEIAMLLEVEEEAVRGLIARARIGLRNYREAAELPCATARSSLAAEHDGRRRPKEVRRHLRTCPSCRSYRQSLKADARALRGLVPVPAGGFASGTALAGGIAAKGVLVGTAVTQVTAACAVSVCAVGGIVLLYPHGLTHRPITPAPARAVHHHSRVRPPEPVASSPSPAGSPSAALSHAAEKRVAASAKAATASAVTKSSTPRTSASPISTTEPSRPTVAHHEGSDPSGGGRDGGHWRGGGGSGGSWDGAGNPSTPNSGSVNSPDANPSPPVSTAGPNPTAVAGSAGSDTSSPPTAGSAQTSGGPLPGGEGHSWNGGDHSSSPLPHGDS